MDASTIIYIILGLGALILQGYMEKKKKEQARQRIEESHQYHQEESIFPLVPDVTEHSEYQMIDIPDSIESKDEIKGEEYIAEEGVSSFEYLENKPHDESEPKDLPAFEIDPRNLILYSEIMAPKFRE
ncbi:hypothetical protein MASR1M46_09940 [Bacteroidales bacterium]